MIPERKIWVQAIIQPIKLSALQERLEDAGFGPAYVSDATGYGRQRGQKSVFRGSEYQTDLLRKIIIEILVDESDLDDVLELVRQGARSGTQGEIGDGKIFVRPIARVIDIS